MIDINSSGVIAKLRAAQNKQKIGLGKRYQVVVKMVLEDLVKHTPQWTGNLASNWRVEVGTAWQGYGGGAQFQGLAVGQAPYHAGMNPAVSTAMAASEEALDRIRWNSKIRIVNYTPYLAEVEEGIGPGGHPIRDINKFDYGNTHGIAMIGYIKMKYGALGYI